MNSKQNSWILIFKKIITSEKIFVIVIGSILSIGIFKPVAAEPTYGYWKQYAETYRQRQENNNLEKNKKCYDTCNELNVKQATHSLRYTMPLNQYQGYSYNTTNYKSYGLSYASNNSYIDNNSYTSPYQAYTEVFGESSYISD
jgi:hypothetical protein